MRDNNHLQTQQKDPSGSGNRRSKSVPDQSKKHLKSSKKSSNSEIETLREGAGFSESPKESADSSLISEVVDDFQFSESTETSKNSMKSEFDTLLEGSGLSELPKESADSSLICEAFLFPLHPEAPSTPSFNSFLHDITSASSGISSDIYTTSTASTYMRQSAEEKTSMEAEKVIKHLRQVQFQLMNSGEIDLQSKRLVDALMEVAVQAFCGSTRENNRSNFLILKKIFLSVALIFPLLFLAFLFGSLHASSATQPYLGPLPT